ncbi:MAG: DUF1636 domain-containing protein [Pseudomonadota bacterium]
MGTRLIICDTCNRDGCEPVNGKKCGEQLADKVEARAEAIKVERHSCLMGCNRACNIALQEDGKISYVLGQFEPTDDAAEAILEYAMKYQASETGRVPYKEWPEGIKGHLTARIPPAE